MHDSIVVNLKTGHKIKKEEVGNKSYRLHQLFRMGYCISDGYVLKPKFFDYFCKYNKICSLEHIRHQIEQGKFGNDSESVLRKIYDRLIIHTGSLIVRSSGGKEDSFEKTFAGVYESITNVNHFDLFLSAVKRVWSSAFSESAFLYSQNKALEGIPVLIQVMVPCTKSGIAFSRNPVNNEKEVVIEACAGNNENIMNNNQAAQKYILSEKNKEVLDTSLLSVQELNKIKRIVLDLESHFHFPCDLEWGLQGRKIFLFQIRPVILHAQPDIYTEPVRDYEECVLLDRYSNPASVCYLSILDSWQKNVYLSLCEDKTVAQISELPLCFLQNRVYWNMQYQKKYFHDETDGSLAHRLMFERNLNKGYRSWYKRLGNYKKKVKEYDQQINAAKSETELVFILDNIMDNFCNYIGIDHFRFLGFAQVLYKRLNEQFQHDPKKMERVLQIVGCLSKSSQTVKVNGELAVLENMIRKHVTLKALFAEDDEITILKKLRADEYADFYRQFCLFVKRHGHRGIDCDDIYYPHWKESPEKIIKLLKNLVGCEEQSKDLNNMKFKIKSREARNKTIRLSGIYMSLRENQRYYFDLSWVLIRKLLLRLAVYYMNCEIITDTQDIFHMTIQEIKDGILLKKGYVTSEVISQRRANFYAMGAITPIYVVKDAQGIMIQTNKRCKSYKCTGLSAGAATGNIVIIRDMDTLAKIHEGDIAVVSTFHPSWTPILGKVAGMIMNYGNMLSHGAVVAREYGIPVVVFNGDAANVFHDGETVELNGTTGRVRIKKEDN